MIDNLIYIFKTFHNFLIQKNCSNQNKTHKHKREKKLKAQMKEQKKK